MTDPNKTNGTNETQPRGKVGSFVRSVGRFLRTFGASSEEEVAATEQARLRLDTISRKAEGMNMTAMAILRKLPEIPNQASTSPLSGHDWHDASGEYFRQWVFCLSFGRVPDGRAAAMYTPLIVEGDHTPRFVLDGMTTEVDTVGFTINAPKNEDGSWGAPYTELSFNSSTRESNGREFDDGTLNGSADATGSVRVVLDENGRIQETWVSRHNQTGLSREKPRPELIQGLPDTLQEILHSVSLTADAYKDLSIDLEK